MPLWRKIFQRHPLALCKICVSHSGLQCPTVSGFLPAPSTMVGIWDIPSSLSLLVPHPLFSLLERASSRPGIHVSFLQRSLLQRVITWLAIPAALSHVVPLFGLPPLLNLSPEWQKPDVTCICHQDNTASSQVWIFPFASLILRLLLDFPVFSSLSCLTAASTYHRRSPC